METDRNTNIRQWIFFSISIVIVLIVAFTIIGLPNPYLKVINDGIDQRERSIINEYLEAKHLRDIPAEIKVTYNILWQGSNRDKDSQQVTHMRYIDCITKDGQDEVLVVLWISDAIVRHAVVCAESYRNSEMRKAVVKAVSGMLGKTVSDKEEADWFPTLDVTLYDWNPLFDTDHWRRTGKLRYDDFVSIPDKAVVFVRENTMTITAKGSTWFYWFADAKGRILGVGMTDS